MYLFLDLETTGLAPTIDKILEVAWVPAHTNFSTSNSIESNGVTPSILAWDLLEADRFVTDMHEKSGLIDDLQHGPTYELSYVEDRVLETMREWEIEHVNCGDDKTWYLAGASVHFDLGFIRVLMPRLAAKLSHRVFDTSTLKAFFSLFITQPTELVNERPHRAENDVLEVVEIAQFYSIMMTKASKAMVAIQVESELQGIITEGTD